ncbi:MAG: hypothetical protein K9L66_08165, partial [Spirochaetaceae bacterium]|nr:hypothetical protein [Spirochaetaceae bacterium]
MMKKITLRFIVWTIVITLILLILWAMRGTTEVRRNEALAYSCMLLAFGGVYELTVWLKTRSRTYRLAFGLGLAGLLLIGWTNGAVGFIGNEDNPANLLYWAVFIVAVTGSLFSKFKPRGMARTLFST